MNRGSCHDRYGAGVRGGAGRCGLLPVLVAVAVVAVACAPADSTLGSVDSVDAVDAVDHVDLVADAPDAPDAPDAADGTTTSAPSAPSAAEVEIPPSTTVPPSPVRLVFTGDVLMHSPLWRRALELGGGVHDFAPFFADVQPFVESADLAVCHLETPVAPPFEPSTSSPRYGVPAEVVDGLAAVGFDHCSTASNHTFDRGVPGVEATIARFRAVGMSQHGMASTPADIEPILLEVGGLRIGHVSATYGYDEGDPPPDEPWRSNLIDVERLVADARLARERGADVVIVSLHWGSSNSQRASDAQRAIAGELAMSQAVDLVVGHHAHVVQPIERWGSMWVAYGLGNLIANMPLGSGPFTSAATGDGVLLDVVIDPALVASGPPGTAVTALVARPVWVDQAAGWVVRDVTTARADPALRAVVGDELDASWERTAAVVGPFLPAAVGG